MFPTITLNSMFSINKHIFDALYNYPIGEESFPLQWDVVVDNILFKYGEMGVVYPDADALERAVTFWAKRKEMMFNRLWNVFVVQYNPIWNKDGTITETRSPNITRSREDIGNAHSNSTGNTESKDDRQCFNSSTYAPVGKTTSTDTAQNTTTTNNNTLERETGTETITRTEGGNIGVTKTQEMISDEWELWITHNVYDTIASEFCKEFCIMLY